MLKKLILAAAGLALAAPAFAHDGGRGHGWGHYRHPHFQPRPVVVMPAPRVFYAPPAPVYYAPAPVYYAPPPVVYRPAPVYAPVYPAPLPPSGVSIRLHFPL
jgi:hypothetical protein